MNAISLQMTEYYLCRLAQDPPTGVAPGQLWPQRDLRLRILSHPDVARIPRDRLPYLVSDGVNRRPGEADVYRRRSPAEEPGPDIQRRRPIPPENDGHGKRAHSSRRNAEEL